MASHFAEENASSDSGEEVDYGDQSLESKNPTEVTEDYWIYARNKSSKNTRGPKENCGKWLIFEPPEKIDSVWAMIKSETASGKLGFASKVSTMKDKDMRNEMNRSSNFVICVYTSDHTDEEDVMRVRERLKTIGFDRKLPYKTDAATFAGAYRTSSGGQRVSKWYC